MIVIIVFEKLVFNNIYIYIYACRVSSPVTERRVIRILDVPKLKPNY